MSYKVYNMDACFYNSLGVYSFEAQCEMLQEIGFDGTYLSLWTEQAFRDLDKLSGVKEKYGLDVAGVYVALDFSLGINNPNNQRILKMLENLEGSSTVEIAIRTVVPGLYPSDPSGDEVVISWLNRVLEIAERRNIDILLYSHLTFWLERHEDAVRLCRKIDHPNLGIVFCGPHWYAAGGGDIDATLEEAAPYIKQANLAGSRRDPLGWGGVATVEPLDQGELDIFAMLGALKKIGFDGMIGFEGWGWGSDIYNKLVRSLNAFRDMEGRVKENPHWADLMR